MQTDDSFVISVFHIQQSERCDTRYAVHAHCEATPSFGSAPSTIKNQ